MKTSTFALLTTAASAQNGIWTGHDWQNTSAGIGISNGVPYGLNSKTTQRLNSSSSINTANINIYSQPNVQRIQRLLTQSQWNQLFPQALTVYTYDGFLKAAAKYPMFCNEYPDPNQLDWACKRELATFFAHTT
jgi:hypothetical protein